MPWVSRGAIAAARQRSPGIDFVSTRRESYARPGALPEVSPGSIEEDLRRRDFTINTLALRLDGRHYGQLLDPLGAQDDLDHGLVRALHLDSFKDDPTRMLRGIRYEQRLGFRIEPKTLRMIREATGWLRQVSPHRLRQELEASVKEERAASMIRRMGRLGLLAEIHPALPYDSGCLRRVRSLSRARPVGLDAALPQSEDGIEWLLWLLDLSPAQVRSVGRRLQFKSRMTAELLSAVRLWRVRRSLAGFRPSQLTRKLDQSPAHSVQAVEKALPSGRLKRLLRTYLTKWRSQRPVTTGADLIRRGVPEGPVYARILERLRAGWIDGTIATPKQEHQALDALLRRVRLRSGVRNRGTSRRRATGT